MYFMYIYISYIFAYRYIICIYIYAHETSAEVDHLTHTIRTQEKVPTNLGQYAHIHVLYVLYIHIYYVYIHIYI